MIAESVFHKNGNKTKNEVVIFKSKVSQAIQSAYSFYILLPLTRRTKSMDFAYLFSIRREYQSRI